MFQELFYNLSSAGLWLSFAICLVIILFTGTRLSRYGDLIAVRTGLGGAWVGLVLLATVTSFPELVTGLSAILVVGEPDLAVGSALGSCIYNLLIIAVLDFAHRPGSIFTAIRQGHSIPAGFAVIMLGAVAGGVYIQHNFLGLRWGPIGVYAIAAPILYFIAVRAVFFYERRERESSISELAIGSPVVASGWLGELARTFALFLLNAAILIGAATALPVIGEGLAVAMDWDQTFVGTIFLALVTSVPELVISVQAVRIGAIDLAIGGILGSNLFDLLIIAIEDFAYLEGPLLAAVDEAHVFTAIAALAMTGIVIVGLCSRARTQPFRVVSWASLGILIVGLLSALVLFQLG